MEVLTNLLQTLITDNSGIGNTLAQRELLLKIANKSHFHLCSTPFERTSIPVFKKIRNEFNHAVRPIFLKYLTKVESQFISTHFSEESQNKMKQGYLPVGWTVHHQKAISCGGLNMTKEYDQRIRKMALTKEEMVLLPEDPEEKDNYILACQLNRYLSMKEKSGLLKSTFHKMFQRHLILLPQDLHMALEEAFLTPQKKHLSREISTPSAHKLFHFPSSPLLIYGSERHLFGDALKPKTMYRSQDELLPFITAHQWQRLR